MANQQNGLNYEFLKGYKIILFKMILNLTIFLRYTFLLIIGKIPWKNYFTLLKRLFLLKETFSSNKFVRIGNRVKMELWLAAFPQPSFWQVCDKFASTDDEPGCASVVIGITKACAYKCPHCYQKMDSGKEMPLERLIEVTHQMQDRRLAFADIEGGEPLLKFARLVEYVANIDNRTEVWINTNGYNLTLEKAITLKRVGVFGAMISTHHFLPEKFDQFVGHEGAFDKARQAFALFNQAGIATCMNCCLNQEALRSGGVEKMMDLAREWNCCFVQMIHSKESGGWLDNQEDIINLNNDIDYLKKMHLQYNTDPNYSDYPSVSVQVFEEAKNHYGCTAGGIDRFYLGHSGEVQPCEFLNVSFGNVQEEDFSVIWERMRNHFKKPGVKWLCSEYGPAINKYMKENQITTTPLPREHAEKVVSGWDKGEDTPMYVKMGMYTDGKKS